MKHYTKLPRIRGYTRIPDAQAPAGGIVRMVRCDLDHTEIPSLGVGYHERGKAHREARAEAWRLEMEVNRGTS